MRRSKEMLPRLPPLVQIEGRSRHHLSLNAKSDFSALPSLFSRFDSFTNKLLMMAKNNVVSADKLVHVKREFRFPNDFLENLVSRYPDCFRLVGSPGEGSLFLELVSWKDELTKSVIEERADKESEMTGIRVRPSFNWKLPLGCFLRKKMSGWVRDWMELSYILSYEDASGGLDQASREMEKRIVGVFHELLSLSVYKRIPVPILGKFIEDYRFSNYYSYWEQWDNGFTDHIAVGS